MEKLFFTNCKPSEYDSLGEIQWVLEQKDAVCKKHGEIPLGKVKLQAQYYDGNNWEIPACPHCGQWFLGLPVSEGERKIVERRRSA